MASAEGCAQDFDEPIAFTIQRVRINEEGGHCLNSGADDEEEPAGYFMLEIDAGRATVEFLVFALDPASAMGTQMPRVRAISRAAVGTLDGHLVGA